MAIRFNCSCGKALSLQDRLAGKKIKCPGCCVISTVQASSTIPMEPSHPDDETQNRPPKMKRRTKKKPPTKESLFKVPEALEMGDLKVSFGDADPWWWDDDQIRYVWERVVFVLVAIGILVGTVYAFRYAYPAQGTVNGLLVALGGLGSFTLLVLAGLAVILEMPKEGFDKIKPYLEFFPDVTAIGSSWLIQGIHMSATDPGDSQIWGWTTSIWLASIAIWTINLLVRVEGNEDFSAFDLIDLVMPILPMTSTLMAAYFRNKDGSLPLDVQDSLTNATRVEVAVQVILTIVLVCRIIVVWQKRGSEQTEE